MIVMEIRYRKIVLLTFLVFGCIALAFANDTTSINRIKAKAIAELNRTIALNKKYLKEKNSDALNFVVSISNVKEIPPADTAVYQRKVPGNNVDFISAAKHSELNDYLKQVYIQEGIACYIVFINFFDYRVNIRLSDDENITGIIAYQTKYDEIKNEGKLSPTIEKLKELHASISDDVYQSIPKDHPFVFMDLGAYCTPTYSGKTCDYIGKHYFYNIPANILPHLRAMISKKFTGTLQGEPDREEVAEIHTHGLATAVIQAKIKEQILNVTDVDDLCDILTEVNYPFDHTTFASSAYAALTVEERIHAIKIFLEAYFVSGSTFGCNEEQKIIAIIKNTPPDQIDSLLSKLERDMLVVEMVDAIDDFGVGGNNYESLLKVLADLVRSSPTFTQRILDLQNLATGVLRSYIWDRSYKFSIMQAPVGTNSYEVDMLEDGRIQIYRSYVEEWRFVRYQTKSEIPLYEEVWVREEQPDQLHPFDLILFIDNSRLGLIDGGTVGGELGMAIMPALFMKYAYDKKFNANAIKGIAMAWDIGSIALGPGALAKVFQVGNRIRKALVIADVLNSGLNLVINIGDLDQSTFGEAIKLYNEVMIAIGVAQIVKSGVVRLPAVVKQMKDWTVKLTKATAKSFLEVMANIRAQMRAAGQSISELINGNKSAESLFSLEEELRREYAQMFPNEVLPSITHNFANVSEELQNIVRSRIPDKADDLLEVLNENIALRQAMEVDRDLIYAWGKVQKLTNFRDDIRFLKSLNTIDGANYAIKHVFEGHLLPPSGNSIQSVRGVHFHTALTNKTSDFVAGEIRIRPGTEIPLTNGLYEGVVEVFDGTNWLVKDLNQGKSTFFPKSMTKEEVIEEVAYAHSRGLEWIPPSGTQSTSNAYQGIMTNGLKFTIAIGQGVSSAPATIPVGFIPTFFPVLTQ